MTTAAPVLRLVEVSKTFTTGFFRRSDVPAVRGVSLELAAGETIGIVGESGSGKSTVGRLALRLLPVSSGEVYVAGIPIHDLPERELRPLRKRMQIVFQDPYASLNPHHSVHQIVAEPLLVHGLARSARDAEPRVRELLAQVGLGADVLQRFPSAFSGGQRQRIAIARAIALEPELLILDEPTSALDVSIQAQVVTLLLELQAKRNLAYVFISHDLALVEHVASRIAVMYRGRIVEVGPRAAIVRAPRHPYTRALLAAVPIISNNAKQLRVVRPIDSQGPVMALRGCAFHPRCDRARPGVCDMDVPPLSLSPSGEGLGSHDGHAVRCFFPLDDPPS